MSPSTSSVNFSNYAISPAGCSSSNNISRSTTTSPVASSIKKRGRGRPRKEVLTKFDESKYQDLSPAERKYKLLRDKNNEASRKSRINRTQIVKKADKVLKRLERTNKRLELKLKHVESLNDQMKRFIEIMLTSQG